MNTPLTKYTPYEKKKPTENIYLIYKINSLTWLKQKHLFVYLKYSSI